MIIEFQNDFNDHLTLFRMGFFGDAHATQILQ